VRLVSTPESGSAVSTTIPPVSSTTSGETSTTLGPVVTSELITFFDFADPSYCSDVAPSDFSDPGIASEIVCNSEGIEVYYTLWDSFKSLNGRAEFHNQSSALTPWFTVEGIQRGLFSEYVLDDGRAVRFWTYDDNPAMPVTGEALRANGDLDGLFSWWADLGSHVATSLTSTSAEDDLLAYLQLANGAGCQTIRASAIENALAELRCDVTVEALQFRAYLDLWPSLDELSSYHDTLVSSYGGVSDTWSFTSEGDITVGRTVEYSYQDTPWFFWSYDEDLISVNSTLLSAGTLADLRAWWENGAAGRN
jgi:hypothetical protein